MPFPAQKETIRGRRSIFNDASASWNYLNFLKKPFPPNGDEAVWLTPAVINISRGLKLVGKEKIRSPNFANASIFAKIIKREGVRCEFAQLAYVSYLCARSAPSEAFPLRRAFKWGDLCEFKEQKGHGLVGVRYISDAAFLAIRLRKRKNLRSEAILRFAFFFDRWE